MKYSQYRSAGGVLYGRKLRFPLVRRPAHGETVASEPSPLAGAAKASRRGYNRAMLPKMTINVKGTTGLIVAAAILVAVLVAFPAYRVFLAISLGIGVVFAALIYLRNKYRPITDKDIENKRPLGLD